MDWDLKMPWDLAELDANPAQNVGSMVGPSSRIQGLDCSVDLKLGGLGDFCVADKCKDQQTVPGSSISPSGSSKRARAPSNATQNACCLVDGCKSDLSVCREYHRRHKVCEVHSKTPIVLVGGQEQRFCQQCSRFHFLVEFDEVKRSCRKRLDGHNRRRRKPQPESITSSSLFANHQGNRFSSYPQIYTSATSEATWPLIVKSEEDPPLYSHPHPHPPMHFLDHRTHLHFSNSFPRTFKENKYFPFSQQNSDHRAPTLEPQRLLKTISSVNSSNSGGGNNNNDNKIFLDSDCALSLLSSTPQTSTLNLGQIVPSSDRIPMGQLLLSYGDGLGLGRYPGPDPHHVSSTGFTCSGLEDENVGSTVLVSDVSGNEMSCHGFFGEGSSDGGSQALPFSWQ